MFSHGKKRDNQVVVLIIIKCIVNIFVVATDCC